MCEIPDNKVELLRAFQAKAGCAWTQRRARQLWRKLKPHLTVEQRRRMGTAWGYVTADRADLPRAELDTVCGEIAREWVDE